MDEASVPLVPLFEEYTNPYKNLPFGYNSLEHTIEDRARLMLYAELRSPSGQGESERHSENGLAKEAHLFPIGGKARKRGDLI